jgi:hypothetical protein
VYGNRLRVSTCCKDVNAAAYDTAERKLCYASSNNSAICLPTFSWSKIACTFDAARTAISARSLYRMASGLVLHVKLRPGLHAWQHAHCAHHQPHYLTATCGYSLLWSCYLPLPAACQSGLSTWPPCMGLDSMQGMHALNAPVHAETGEKNWPCEKRYNGCVHERTLQDDWHVESWCYAVHAHGSQVSADASTPFSPLHARPLGIVSFTHVSLRTHLRKTTCLLQTPPLWHSADNLFQN